MTTVVNIYKISDDWLSNPEFVYIGRRGRTFNCRFGNPIVIGRACQICDERHTLGRQTLVCYETYLRRRLETDESFKRDFLKLRGKTLVCFCKPKPCHGDVIIKVLEELQ